MAAPEKLQPGDESAQVAKAKKPGRPPLPPDNRRTGRIHLRTYPDIEAKVKRNGTEWLEALVRRARDAPQT